MNPIKEGCLQQDKGKHKRYSSCLSRPRQEWRRIPRSDSELTRCSGAELCSRYLTRQAPSRVESDGIRAGGGRGFTSATFPINLTATQRRPIQREYCDCPDSPIGSFPKSSLCEHATRVNRSYLPRLRSPRKARLKRQALSEGQDRPRTMPTDHRSQSERDWAYAKRALARGDDPEDIVSEELPIIVLKIRTTRITTHDTP